LKHKIGTSVLSIRSLGYSSFWRRLKHKFRIYIGLNRLAWAHHIRDDGSYV
jgi:hypothetical protein